MIIKLKKINAFILMRKKEANGTNMFRFYERQDTHHRNINIY